MAASTQIDQGYGTDLGSTQANVTRHDFLSADVAQSSDLRNTYPITVPGAGTNYSYEVWHRLNVTAMGGSTRIYTIRHYTVSATPATGIALASSAETGTPSNETGTTPINTDSTKADQTFPTSDPSASNIYGDLTGTGTSGWVVSQADVGTSATAGYSQDTTWKYAEVA